MRDITYYSTTYNNEKSYWWYTARLSILKSVFEKYVSISRSKILNIGCGTGYISKEFSLYGNVTNIDISPHALAFCKANELEYLVRGNAIALPFRSAFFDCVMAYDLLEHIKDDLYALKEMKRCLHSSGKLILTVPAFKSLWSSMDDIDEHERRYTKKNLRTSVEKAGLKVIKMSYFNTFLFPLAVSKRMIERLFNKQVSEETFLPRMHPFLNTMFHLIFSAEKFFLRYLDFPFGLSIILIAKA